MTSNPATKFRTFLFSKVLGVEPREYVPVAWSFAYFFCVLSSYYILRPIREAMAVSSGAGTVPNLFLGTFVVTLFAVPVFGWITSRYPRKSFLPWIYLFFIFNILIFWVFFLKFEEGSTNQIWLGRAFFVWLSVFNLNVVSVFWSFMADIYSRVQGRRLFGLITAAGSIGAVIGSAVTSKLAVDFGFAVLFPVAASVLGMAILCIGQLKKWAADSSAQDSGKPSKVDKPLGGTALGGIKHVFSSKYFLGIAASSLIASLLGTALYMFAAQLVEETIAGDDARIEFFSNMNFWASLIALVGQMFLVRHVVTRWGIGRSLAMMPLISVVGFTVLAMDPTLAVVAALTILRRGLGFAFSKPPTDMLYSVVSPEDKYKAKNFIDTSIYRFGDIVGSRVVEFLMGGKVLGMVFVTLGIAGVSVVMMPFAAIWFVVSLWLGRDYKRKAKTLAKQGVE